MVFCRKPKVNLCKTREWVISARYSKMQFPFFNNSVQGSIKKSWCVSEQFSAHVLSALDLCLLDGKLLLVTRTQVRFLEQCFHAASCSGTVNASDPALGDVNSALPHCCVLASERWELASVLSVSAGKKVSCEGVKTWKLKACKLGSEKLCREQSIRVGKGSLQRFYP